MTIHAHWRVVKLARGMAQELYEEVMRDNEVYKQWKLQCPELSPKFLRRRFVELATPGLIESARATLAQLLTTGLDESLKAEIYEALIKDNLLVQGRAKHEAILQLLKGPIGHA